MKKALVYVQSAMTTVALLISTTLLAQNTSPYWSLVGNTNATASSKLGTTNSIPLRLMTNNTTRIYISPSAGYVGIGTSSPSARLHVNAASGTSPLRVQINATTKLYMSSAGGLSVGSSTAAPSNGLYVAGKVGIGTNAPANKLHVVGSARFDSAVIIYNGGLSASTTNIAAISGTSNYNNGLYGYSGSQAGVYGVSSSLTKAGVEGYGRYGVYGNTNSGYGYGVFGNGTYGVGVAGSSTENRAVVGSSTNSNGGYFESFGTTGLRATTVNGAYAAAFDGYVYSTGGYHTSDRNLKQKVEPFDDALNLIAKLEPRYYEFKTDDRYRFLHLPKGRHYGLIAQDVEALLPNLVATADHEVVHPMSIQKDQTSVIAPPDPSVARESITIKALNYTELIPIMIKGIQELNEKLIEENNQLRKEIAGIKQMVIGLKNANNSASLSSAYLEQNIPNPSGGSTVIRYYLPQNVSSAQLVVTDAIGQIVKSITLNSKGSGQISLNTHALIAGTYTYSLLIDRKQADSKQLIVTR